MGHKEGAVNKTIFILTSLSLMFNGISPEHTYIQVYTQTFFFIIISLTPVASAFIPTKVL